MKLQPYKKYKHSDIEWLGEIPEHWNNCRNKEIFYEISDKSETGKETLLTVSHITGVTPRSEKNVNMFFAETMEGYKICQEGDLIINTMWAWMGALGTSKYMGICSPAYNIYRAYREIDYTHQYFDCLFRIPNFIVEMTRYSKGIVASRLRLYPKDFFRIKTPLPPLQEQTQIANYLDQKTIQIDQKIHLFQQKINKYTELQKALINETVCRGLDKNVPMKDSGVEWIGEIPVHWEVSAIKRLFEVIGSGTTPKSGSKEYYENGSVNWINTGDLKNNIIEKCKYKVTTKALEDYSTLKIYPKNTLLIAMYGATIGKIALMNIEGCTNQACCALGKSKQLKMKYLFYWFLSNKNKVVSLSFGGTQPNISQNLIKDLIVHIPPIKEQIDIINFLNKKTTQIQKITTNLQSQIHTLKELRKTLINDIVTGKLKVPSVHE